MNTKHAALLISLTALGSLTASAEQFSYSGSDLNDLAYAGAPGDAQFVLGTPDVAQLYTADLSINGDSPAVYAYFSPGITLDSLSANYDLAAGSTVDPYWVLWMTDDPSYTLPIVSTYGGSLDGSSLIHTGDLVNGSITLSALDTDIDPNSGLAYGGETVAWVGLEIGDGGNGVGTANIQSITIDGAVPENASTILLLGCGLVGLGLMSQRKSLLRASK